VNHVATERFWRLYDKLPESVQELADKNFALLKEDSRHPSLHFKKVGSVWSARIGLRYRALAALDGETYVWFWIGDHGAYDRLIS
jgi:hypothetical protein